MSHVNNMYFICMSHACHTCGIYVVYIHWQETIVVITNSHCKSVIINGTIFYRWDRYNIVKSTIIILYYIFVGWYGHEK